MSSSGRRFSFTLLWQRARPAAAFFTAALMVASGETHFPAVAVSQIFIWALPVGFLLLEIIAFPLGKEGRRHAGFVHCLWFVLGLRAVYQSAGPYTSLLFPLVCLAFAVMAAIIGPGHTVLLAGLFTVLGLGHALYEGERIAWLNVSVEALSLGAFILAAGFSVGRERQKRKAAEETLRQLQEEAEDFQRDDTVHRLSGLSEQKRRQDDLRSLVALHRTFSQTLEKGRQLLGADSVALYWRTHAADSFHLREAAPRQNLALPSHIPTSSPLIHRLLSTDTSQRLSPAGRPNRLGFELAAHLLLAPVSGESEIPGLLIAMRKEGARFSAAEEKLAALLALHLHQLHHHAVLVRRMEAQAARFRSLANLGHRLSRTLEEKEILASVLRAVRAIAEPAATALILPDEDGRPVIAAREGGIPLEAEGGAVAPELCLAGWVLREQKTLLLPDLAGREKKTPLLGPDFDPPGMGSALLLPLTLQRDGCGVLVCFGREPAAFSGYVVRVMEMLTDWAAVSLQNARLYEEMGRRAVTDGLTGLLNHRAFQEKLVEEVERAGRLASHFAVVLADVDHFKLINDTYGHPAGDVVLKTVAGTLRSSVRRVDTVARYGGEEFVLILMGAEGAGAFELCERIRKKVERLCFQAEGKEFRVTLSLGIALYPDQAVRPPDLIALADQALYRAKKAGRNRTLIAVISPARRRASR